MREGGWHVLGSRSPALYLWSERRIVYRHSRPPSRPQHACYLYAMVGGEVVMVGLRGSRRECRRLDYTDGGLMVYRDLGPMYEAVAHVDAGLSAVLEAGRLRCEAEVAARHLWAAGERVSAPKPPAVVSVPVERGGWYLTRGRRFLYCYEVACGKAYCWTYAQDGRRVGELLGEEPGFVRVCAATGRADGGVDGPSADDVVRAWLGVPRVVQVAALPMHMRPRGGVAAQALQA
jgi:hypothetical protein